MRRNRKLKNVIIVENNILNGSNIYLKPELIEPDGQTDKFMDFIGAVHMNFGI